MEIQIVKKDQQARGQFNNGEILENKPIGFPREGGILKPYSNLFYWAHAWSDNGSTIGLHPHQGFEIMSFVLEGSIEHYDTAHQEWRKLDKGDAQIIRAGSGISHSEKLNAGAHIFQIWLDPDLEETLMKEASYNDYVSNDFPIKEEDGITKKIYRGEGSPLNMESDGIEIYELEIQPGAKTILLPSNKTCSVYLIKGSIEIEGNGLERDDFFIINEADSILLNVIEPTILFTIASPVELAYKTYAERAKFS